MVVVVYECYNSRVTSINGGNVNFTNNDVLHIVSFIVE